MRPSVAFFCLRPCKIIKLATKGKVETKKLPFLKCGNVKVEFSLSDLTKRFFTSLEEILKPDGIKLSCKAVPIINNKKVMEFKTVEDVHIIKNFVEDCSSEYNSSAAIEEINFQATL